MMIPGGLGEIQCNIFAGTLSGNALQWFSGIPEGTIIFFFIISVVLVVTCH